ncbi:hypothetical protein HAX54_029635 [Datura stramonium]|uniref:Uncharacterized protein n=1 Tax=Datura stramonium TaxID=4076 RepID=A0ABS8V8M3_DATST|nr:hypothetical protein [Datura stramonium]
MIIKVIHDRCRVEKVKRKRPNSDVVEENNKLLIFDKEKMSHRSKKTNTSKSQVAFDSRWNRKRPASAEEYMEEQVDRSKDIFPERQYRLNAVEPYGQRWYQMFVPAVPSFLE